MAVEIDGAADDLRVAGEALAPEAFADDDDGVAAGDGVLADLEAAAEHGAHAEQIEEVGGDDLPVRPGELVVADGERGRGRHRDGRAGENGVERSEIADVLERGVAAAPVGEDDGEAGLVDRARNRALDEVAQPAKDGGVGPDAQREREYHDGGEAGRLAELSESVAEIGEHGRRVKGEV